MPGLGRERRRRRGHKQERQGHQAPHANTHHSQEAEHIHRSASGGGGGRRSLPRRTSPSPSSVGRSPSTALGAVKDASLLQTGEGARAVMWGVRVGLCERTEAGPSGIGKPEPL